MVDATNHGDVYREDVKQTNAAVRLLCFAFVLACIFDPADRVLGAKVWLFVVLWIATLAVNWPVRDRVLLPIGLVVAVLLFITIPLLSISWYYITCGTQPYAGFSLFKSYLLVSLTIILITSRLDVVPFLCAALTVLALLTAALFIAVQLHPELLAILFGLSERFGVITVGIRSYGEGLSFTQINFVTSPLLTISIAYFFDRAMCEPVVRLKVVYLALTAISIIGMLLAGLRNTMAVALLLPCLLWPLYTRRVALNGLISLGALIVLSLPFIKKLAAFLDPAELSNNVKLTYLGDYKAILSEPVTLLFGQGLGAYYRWSSSGQADFEKTGANFYYITELTYPEMIRSFGLFGSAIMMMILLFPVAHAFLAVSNTRQRAIALGFLAYLGMCATNPLLFSSTGMLIFSVMLAMTFQHTLMRSLS